MKKIFKKILLPIVTILLLVGCTSESETDSASTDSGTANNNSEDVYTPYAGAQFSLPYFIDHSAGLEMGAEIYGHETSVVGPSDYDMTSLTTAIEQQISQDPTALFVSAFEDTVAPAINDAVDAGIPVFTIDMDTVESNRDVFIGGDNFEYGRVHAQTIAEHMGEAGTILLHYNVGQNSQEERAAGFQEELENYPDIEIVQTVAGQKDVSTDADAIKAALQANPDVNGISTLVSTGAVAASTAVNELGQSGEVTIIADSKDEATLNLIDSGDVEATVAIKTLTENLFASMLVDGLINGDITISTDDEAAGISPLPSFIDVGTFTITDENVEYFYQDEGETDADELVIEEPSEDDVYYLVGGLLEQQYFIDHRMGFEAAAEELGVTGRFIGTTDYDMTAQAQMIEDAIAQDPAGIMVMAFEDTLAPAINRAKEAGIPVITIDMDTIESDRDFFVGGDNVEYGRIHARTIADALGEEGKILIHHNVGQNSQEERAAGFMEEIENYPDIEVVQTVAGQTTVPQDADAIKAALQANPDVDGVSTMVSTGGVAAATAVRELGQQGEITIVSDSKDDATLQLIEDGEIHSTVAIKTRTEPYIAMKILALMNYTNIEISDDDESAGIDILPTRVDIGTFVINEDNAEYFYLEE